MNDTEMVLGMEHDTERWAISEAKRIDDINKSNQRVIKWLKKCLLNFPTERH